MKKTARQYWALLLALVMISAVCFMFSGRKSGMFIDEIYSYGLANSSYAPFLDDIKGGDMVGKTFTRAELLDYVSVMGSESVDFGSVYYNQANDVHPPLYYWLLNIASAINHDGFTKWTGLILDYIIYILAILVLYKLVLTLGGSRENAAASAVLYGLSVIGMSTMLMIRMYVLMMLLTLCLALEIAELIRDFRPAICILVGITLLAGLFTQYYFVFYAFFLCASYVLYALIKKQYRALAWFIPCALIGALLLIPLFPACISQLFSGELVSGNSAMDNLKNPSIYAFRFKRFFIEFVYHGMKAAVYTGVVLVIALAVRFRALCAAVKEKRLNCSALVIILPAFIVLPLVAVMSPVDEPRYIYNIIPIFVLAVSFLIYLLENSLGEIKNERTVKCGAMLLIMALALWEARCTPPDYLYPEYAEYDAIIAEYADAPCVYFSDNKFEGLTQDLLQLLQFDDFYVTDKEHVSALTDYAGDAEKVVAYIDISVFWSSGYDTDEILSLAATQTDYVNSELLYQNGLSATYLLYR